MTSSLLDHVHAYIAKCEPANNGSRNNSAFNIAGHCAAFRMADTGESLGERDVLNVVRSWNLRNPEPLDDSELSATVHSALNSGTPREPKIVRVKAAMPSKPLRIARTPQEIDDEETRIADSLRTERRLDDIGNGERFAKQHGDGVRYVPALKSWSIFAGTRWAMDDMHAIDGLAKATSRSIFLEAADCDDDARRKRIARFAEDSASMSRIAAMLASAKSEPGIAVRPDVFDVDRMMFNAGNATINLRTGEAQAHNRADMISKLAPVLFDPDAPCPTFLQTLDRIMDGNADMIGFLQRAVGYSLSGLTGERCMFILHGSGANGKTVFLETIGALLGEYASAVPASTILLSRNDDRPRNDLADLMGVRFASCVETNEDRRIDEALVKIATGGDRITARRLYCEHVTYTPAFKLWMASNHKPKIVGTDDAIWTRIRLVPFAVVIPEDERDQHLKSKLLAELPGILNWAIAGCLAWQRDGLQPPAPVLDATGEYRAEQDHVQDFIADACIVGDGVSASAADISKAYAAWCARAGCEPLNQNALGRRLDRFPREKCPVTRRTIRRGIGILTEDNR